MEQLIGPELTSNPIQHVRIKPPATKLTSNEIRPHIAATDWHQDRAVALEDADQTDMVTIWIAITDATIENGCLQVQPQTLGQTILPHCPRTQTGIADGFINEARAIPLPVAAGGAVLFHPLTPHGSLDNTTGGFRWSFDIRFSATGQPTGRSHFPDFIARSRANPGSELRDWQACKSLWEEARARLSQAPHIDIHRWSSDAPYCA
jgi:ectoine hydroxylase-related dioxygenase (phytanoyl-CoA dioxygenase family)